LLVVAGLETGAATVDHPVVVKTTQVELFAAIRLDARAGLSGRAVARKHRVGCRTSSTRSVAGRARW